MEQLARGKVESASQIALGILAWRHDFLLLAFRHPGRPDFGEEMDIKLIGKDHNLMRLQVLSMKANASQALDALRVVVFSHQLGAFPHPTHLMEPTPNRPR
jgi:hypothetical protein